jgi:hypothetical protein
MRLRSLRSRLHYHLTGRPRASLNPFREPGQAQWASGALLSRTPLILGTSQNGDTPLGLATILGPELADRDVLFLVFLTWSHESPRRAWKLAELIRLYRLRHPRHRFLVLANTALEVDRLRASRADAVLANHNLFADEAVFRPIAGAVVDHDAVLNARMHPFKRHYLASEAGRVALVYYRDGTLSGEESESYFASVRAALPHATFANERGGERYRWLSPEEVNGWLNRARVGLSLSAEEGANFASIEYLLAGLPVVSTVSRGGRERYFDPADCIVCDADRREIGEAVAALSARNIPRQAVRGRVLRQIEAERDELRRAIAERAQSWSPKAPDPDMRAFRHLARWRRASDLERDMRVELAAFLSPTGQVS